MLYFIFIHTFNYTVGCNGQCHIEDDMLSNDVAYTRGQCIDVQAIGLLCEVSV